MISADTRPLQILIVEDNPGDVRLAEEALRENAAPPMVHVALDGEAGLAFLHRKGANAEAPRPDLILLDLNLPGKDGRDVLREIKEDPGLKPIPVVIFTSSAAEADVIECYRRSCNCYVRKPLAFEDFARTLRSIEGFWAGIARLPSRYD